MDQNLLDRINTVLNTVADDTIDSSKTLASRIRTITDAIGSESISGLLEGIVKSMPEMTEKLGKEAPDIEIIDHAIRFTAAIIPIMKNIFTHEFRNAIDHGVGNG